MQFFEFLNQRKVEYVLLRWWEELPAYPEGEDINILVADEHRDLINDLVTMYGSRGTKCDIYTVSGAKNGSRFDIPVFPYHLSKVLLTTKMFYNGAFVPSPLPYFASVAYHAVLHKGVDSGVPGFEGKPTNVLYDYTSVLKELARKLGIKVEISVHGLYGWLKKEGYAPANDTLTKLIENQPELSMLEESLYSDSRGGELLVYVIRERILQDGLLGDFTTFLVENFGFDVLDVRLLDDREKESCRINIRGGKWDKGPFAYSGGTPVALVSAYDYYPTPLASQERKKQTRMTNRNNLRAKYAFRERVHHSGLPQSNYNGVHSADNELDARFYLSLLGKEYCEKIFIEVENRRIRYARKWGVKKVLSAGKISKVELITFGQELAVKKTFRLGKDPFFKRELFAVRELSKVLSFIPPLLEEGEGYFVVPYLENILERMPEKEKKRILISKAKEIRGVIKHLDAQGLRYPDFTPESLIITPDNKLYCTGFSFLYKPKNYPAKIEEPFEVAALPIEFEGDFPPEYSPTLSSYEKVWGPYLGPWKKEVENKVHV